MTNLDEVKSRIERLITEVDRHSYRYHVLDSPEIGGVEYNIIWDLKQLDLDYIQLLILELPTQRIGVAPV